MTGFLLDTNIPSELVRPHPEPKVKTWVVAQNLDTLFISAVSFGELRKGIVLRSPGKRRTELELWIETDIAAVFRSYSATDTFDFRAVGSLGAERQLAGRPLNIADGMIAATALEYDFTVVTRNVKDFDQLGVTLFNPWENA